MKTKNAACIVLGAPKFKRIASLLLSLAMFFTLTAGIDFSAFAENVSYEYELLEDGTAEIIKYSGTETHLVIPSVIDGYTVTSLGKESFYGCNKLEAIEIPDSVSNIGESAFCFCSSLKTIVIPNGVTKLSGYLFNSCSALESIVLPKNLISIGAHTFWGCISLKSINLPKSLETIGDYAFFHCDSLKIVTIPKNVISIGNGAFCFCVNLEKVFLPKSLKSIGEKAFNHCDNLSELYYAGSKNEFDGIEISNDNDNLYDLEINYNYSNIPFVDLRSDEYEEYSDYILYTSVYNSFITGTNPPANNVFSPRISINRAMFVTILYRMAGSPYDNGNNPYKSTPFIDITNTSAYYYNAACWALENGITTETVFKPFDNVTREQAASMLFRYATANDWVDEAYKTADITKYPDYSSVHIWAQEPMQWANYNKMITGTQQGYLNPQGATQRVHATKILYGFGTSCGIGNFE